MKRFTLRLMILLWLVVAPSGLPAAPALVVAPPRPAADPIVVTDQPVNEGIAAIVDDEIITYMDVEEQSAETVKLLRQNLTGDELNAQIRKAKLNVIKALIDRMLIIHEFKREGSVIPDDSVQQRINDVIKIQYSGDAAQFEKALAEHDMTLAEYKKEITDNAIVGYMRNKNVVQKLDSLKPATPYNRDQLTATIQNSWLNTLYRKSYVKNFYGSP